MDFQGFSIHTAKCKRRECEVDKIVGVSNVPGTDAEFIVHLRTEDEEVALMTLSLAEVRDLCRRFDKAVAQIKELGRCDGV